MNYLAHFYLAQRSQIDERAGYILGGLLGDFVKGPLDAESNRQLLENERLPSSTSQGIALHRFIDANFDTLQDIRAVKQAQTPELRRYSGILIDLAFDSILSHRWQVTGTQETLAEFEQFVVSTLLPYRNEIPNRATRLINVFSDYRILSRYGEKSVLENTLMRIADRLKSTELKASTHALWETKNSLTPSFETILKEMQTLTENFIENQ